MSRRHLDELNDGDAEFLLQDIDGKNPKKSEDSPQIDIVDDIQYYRDAGQ